MGVLNVIDGDDRDRSKCFSVDGVDIFTTIRALRSKIHEKHRHAPVFQRLFFCGLELCDDDITLGEINWHADGLANVILFHSDSQVLCFKTPSGLTFSIDAPSDASEKEALKSHILRTQQHLRNELSRHFEAHTHLLDLLGDAEQQPDLLDALTAVADTRQGEASTPEVETREIDAECLGGNLDIRFFGLLNSHMKEDTGKLAKKPTFLVAGGVHGNEVRAMQGVELLQAYLDTSVDEEGSLAKAILDRCTIVSVARINKVGYLAGARCCPARGVPVRYGGGQVWVEWDQKGSINPPAGWQDPNRGWDTNDTLVKDLIENLLTNDLTRPDLILWNHDWAVPQGKLYSVGMPDRAVFVGASRIFAEYYPTKTVFGTPWEHIEEFSGAGNCDGETVMTGEVFERFGIPSHTLETYCDGEEAAEVQCALSLYLLAKHAGIEMEEEELVTKVLQVSRRALRS
eukprot:gene18027-21468_t